MTVFRFIAAEKTTYPISLMCRTLDVSRSGYHAREARPPSERSRLDRVLSARITQMHERSRASYGARRIHLDLRDEGVRVGRKRDERLMRGQGLSGYVKRRKLRTTFSVPGVRVADDLVERDFNPPAPDRLWASDIPARIWAQYPGERPVAPDCPGGRLRNPVGPADELGAPAATGFGGTLHAGCPLSCNPYDPSRTVLRR